MEITGRIIAVLPVQGGISKNGNEWKKQEYVLETHDQYPKKVCFQIFGADRIDQAAIQPGEELTVFFDIDSREYQGRWFTNISAWKVERPMAAAPQSAPGAMTPENVVPASAPAASAVPDFGPANPIDCLSNKQKGHSFSVKDYDLFVRELYLLGQRGIAFSI